MEHEMEKDKKTEEKVKSLYEESCKHEDKKLTKGCTSLMYACQQGLNSTVVNELRKKPNTVHRRDKKNKSALHYCSGQRDLVAAASVAMAAPDLMESPDEDGFTPLHLAVIQGNLSLVNLLLASNADVNALDNEGHSVVHWATVCGEIDALRAVLSAGADVSIPDVNGGTPLHYAAQMCGANYDGRTGSASSKLALQILTTLLEHPDSSVEVVDKDGRQPLLWAASAGSSHAVLALIKAGARVESADKDGLTALHCAASRGHTDCIDALINLCGTPTDLIDSNGCTALHYAVTLGHADATAQLLDLEADPNRQDRKGRTPAHCGCAKGQFETVKTLGARNANLWLRNARGDLPIHEAASSGRRELVQWLIQQRPNQINTTSNDGRTLLHIAAGHDSTDMCKVLLDVGSEVNSIYRTPRNVVMTPIDCALQKGHRSTAKFLQLYGGLPASKLQLSGIRPHNVLNDQELVKPLKFSEKEEKDQTDLSKTVQKRYVVYVKRSDSEKVIPVHPPQRSRHKKKLCSHHQRRTSSCSENVILHRYDSSSDLNRSKSSLELCRRKMSRDQDKYADSSSCENYSSCEECARYGKYRKLKKHHSHERRRKSHGCEYHHEDLSDERRRERRRKRKEKRKKKSESDKSESSSDETEIYVCKRKRSKQRGKHKKKYIKDSNGDDTQKSDHGALKVDENFTKGYEITIEMESQTADKKSTKHLTEKKQEAVKIVSVETQTRPCSAKQETVKKRPQSARVSSAQRKQKLQQDKQVIIEEPSVKQLDEKQKQATPTIDPFSREDFSDDGTSEGGAQQVTTQVQIHSVAEPMENEDDDGKVTQGEEEHKDTDDFLTDATYTIDNLDLSKYQLEQLEEQQRQESIENEEMDNIYNLSILRTPDENQTVGISEKSDDNIDQKQEIDNEEQHFEEENSSPEINETKDLCETMDRTESTVKRDLMVRKDSKLLKNVRDSKEKFDSKDSIDSSDTKELKEYRKDSLKESAFIELDTVDESPQPVKGKKSLKEKSIERSASKKHLTARASEPAFKNIQPPPAPPPLTKKLSMLKNSSPRKGSAVQVLEEIYSPDLTNDTSPEHRSITVLTDTPRRSRRPVNVQEKKITRKLSSNRTPIKIQASSEEVSDKRATPSKKAKSQDRSPLSRQSSVVIKSRRPLVKKEDMAETKSNKKSFMLIQQDTENDVDQISDEDLEDDMVPPPPSSRRSSFTIVDELPMVSGSKENTDSIEDSEESPKQSFQIIDPDESPPAPIIKKSSSTSLVSTERKEKSEKNQKIEKMQKAEKENKTEKLSKVEKAIEKIEETVSAEPDSSPIKPPTSAGRRKRLKKRTKSNKLSDESDDENFSEKIIGSEQQHSKDQDSGFEPSPRAIKTKSYSPRAIRTASHLPRKPAFTMIEERSQSGRVLGRKPGDQNAVNMTTVTQSIQRNIRRYYMERKIFQHLLELKSLQIRSNKTNEAMLVKRAVDDYHKSTEALGYETGTTLRRYPMQEYTFKNFEVFLYETLKTLQKAGTYNFQNISDVYREAERRLSPKLRSFEKALHCTTKTHRCLHAAHAYTGIPCAAYIPMMNHHTVPKFGFGKYKTSGISRFYLPKILTTQAHCGNRMALELSHGETKQLIPLPSEKLDSNKRYYVTFTVKGNEPTPATTTTTQEEQSSSDPPITNEVK